MSQSTVVTLVTSVSFLPIQLEDLLLLDCCLLAGLRLSGSAGKKMAEYVDSNNKLNDVQSWAVVKSCKISHNWPVSNTPSLLHAADKDCNTCILAEPT